MIDNEWVNQTIFKQHPKKSRSNNAAFDYFRSEINDYQWQERVTKLAERIFNLRHIPNLNIVIDAIISGELVSRFAELDIGSHLYSRNIEFEYVLPSYKKGLDYDIRIIAPMIINCEVKHKIESTNLSENTINKAIRESANQLPNDNPSIIFIKIPEDWTKNELLSVILNKTFDSFFRRKSLTTLGIMVRWEESSYDMPGVFYWKYRFHKNNYFNYLPEHESFIQLLDGKRNKWCSFSDFINEQQ
jgi:hypothetical protein